MAQLNICINSENTIGRGQVSAQNVRNGVNE